MIKPVCSSTVHRLHRMMTQDNDDTQRTIHDSIGSSLPNEPIMFAQRKYLALFYPCTNQLHIPVQVIEERQKVENEFNPAFLLRSTQLICIHYGCWIIQPRSTHHRSVHVPVIHGWHYVFGFLNTGSIWKLDFYEVRELHVWTLCFISRLSFLPGSKVELLLTFCLYLLIIQQKIEKRTKKTWLPFWEYKWVLFPVKHSLLHKGPLEVNLNLTWTLQLHTKLNFGFYVTGRSFHLHPLSLKYSRTCFEESLKFTMEMATNDRWPYKGGA